MFTGIIKHLGKINSIANSQNNVILEVESSLTPELSIDQSVSHNGVCLTVETISEGSYSVVAIEETMRKTSLYNWSVGQVINLETAMNASALLDGHIVQGHVDGCSEILEVADQGGSTKFKLKYPQQGHGIVVEKGSVTLDGVSLTCFDVSEDSLSVAIIPYTLDHTCIKNWTVGDKVNTEFDILGKLVQKQLSVYLNQTTLGK